MERIWRNPPRFIILSTPRFPRGQHCYLWHHTREPLSCHCTSSTFISSQRNFEEESSFAIVLMNTLSETEGLCAGLFFAMMQWVPRVSLLSWVCQETSWDSRNKRISIFCQMLNFNSTFSIIIFIFNLSSEINVSYWIKPFCPIVTWNPWSISPFYLLTYLIINLVESIS